MARPKGGKNKTWRGKPVRSREERFWAMVDKGDGCWPWNGGVINKHGYGSFRDSHGMRSAHRVSWELSFGPIPLGLNVLHHCDNPPCVRPDHLFLGTQTDNMTDMAQKGRGAIENKSGAKLTIEQVAQIRLLLLHGRRIAEIADCFGLSKQSIHNIRSGKTWKRLS